MTLNAGYTHQTDSNLFRLPPGADLHALIGRSSAEEQIDITSLGFGIDKPYSLQRFELGLNLIDYRYQNFSYLNFTAENHNAAWRWALTPRLTGNLSSDRTETLNTFLDYQGYSQRNRRINHVNRFDAAYGLWGAWYLLGGVTRSTLGNEQTLVAQSDYSATAADTGLRYVFASGSSLAYTVKKTDGVYVNPAASAPSDYDGSFQQIDKGFQSVWILSGKSTADFNASHVTRTHPNFPQADFSGYTTAARLSWRLSGKSTLTGSWGRDLSSYQSGSISYLQADRYELAPSWKASAKTLVRLSHTLTLRDYFGSPSGQLTNLRSESLRDTRVSLDWFAHRRVTVSASVQRSSRSSSTPGYDFESTLASLSAQLTY